MNKRIDPLGLLNSSETSSNSVLAMTTNPTQVTARVENTDLGKCPICKQSMPIILVGSEMGAECSAYVCTEHCVCVPTKD